MARYRAIDVNQPAAGELRRTQADRCSPKFRVDEISPSCDGRMPISGVSVRHDTVLLFVTRHNRTLKDRLRENILSLRQDINGRPPFHVGQLLALSTDPYGWQEMLVGEVMSVEDGTGGTALILSEPIGTRQAFRPRGVAHVWYYGAHFDVKSGDMVRFIYDADEGRSEIAVRLRWRDADGARLEMETRGQRDKAKRLAREWIETHPL